jgi:hypothetical protein
MVFPVTMSGVNSAKLLIPSSILQFKYELLIMDYEL